MIQVKLIRNPSGQFWAGTELEKHGKVACTSWTMSGEAVSNLIHSVCRILKSKPVFEIEFEGEFYHAHPI